MPKNQPGDNGLIVSFFTRQITKGKPRNEEWVRIASPTDIKSVFMARADSVSHVDADSGDRITYAERFPRQYDEYKTGKTKNLDATIRDLQAQLAAAKSARGDSVDPVEVEADTPAEDQPDANREPVSEDATPNFDAMDEDDLRDFIFEKTGKEVSANITRKETLVEKAQEALKG